MVLNGHSRDSLTVDNAMGSTLDKFGTGSAAGLNVNFYGAAANAVRAGDKLTRLQGGTGDNAAQALKSTVHPQDQVGTFLGENQQTQDGAKNDSRGFWANIWNIMKGEDTPHNCYGSGPSGCKTYYWPNSPTGPIFNAPPNSSGPARPPAQPNLDNEQQLSTIRKQINGTSLNGFAEKISTPASQSEGTYSPPLDGLLNLKHQLQEQ